jgi:hypothetical protein
MNYQDNNNYIIYKVENISNGEVYIGATTKSLDARQKDHIERANRGDSGRFQNAIATFGAEAFSWNQIDTGASTDELAQKEKEYIIQYDSKESGYNVDCGGGVRKTVYQYDIITGELVDKYPNLSVAGAVVGLAKQGLSNVCLSVNKAYRGFYWTYDYIDKFLPLKDLRRKKVQQFNLEGEFINEFDSVSEASKQTECNKSSISKVCRFERKSSGGYFWRFIQ